MLTPKLKPLVAHGIMIIREGKILFTQRKGALGYGTYGFPGGKLEANEGFEEGMLRELAEECGTEMKIKNMRFMLLANILDYAPKHFVNICFAAEWESGEPQDVEPEKMGPWEWHAIDKLPSPLFAPARIIIDAYKSGQTYRDAKL